MCSIISGVEVRGHGREVREEGCGGPVWLAGRGSGSHVGVTSAVTDGRQLEVSGAGGGRCSCRFPSETNISRQ